MVTGGYVKGGIWQISHEITEINKKIGINFHMSSNISSIDNNKMKISFEKENKNYEIDYDYLIFATDPITPSKILKNKDLQSEIEDNDFLGTSGKITAFFKNPVIWKESSPYKNSDSAFRFIFSNQTLSDFEKSSQNVITNSNDYSPSYIQVYAEGAAQRILNNKEPFDKLIFLGGRVDFPSPYAVKGGASRNGSVLVIQNVMYSSLTIYPLPKDNEYILLSKLKERFK